MMTVNEDGSMSFEGLNSYDKKVKFTVTAKGTDLMTIHSPQSTIHKVMHNGQLFIRKNGKNYTIMGTNH